MPTLVSGAGGCAFPEKEPYLLPKKRQKDLDRLLSAWRSISDMVGCFGRHVSSNGIDRLDSGDPDVIATDSEVLGIETEWLIDGVRATPMADAAGLTDGFRTESIWTPSRFTQRLACDGHWVDLPRESVNS